MGFNDAFLERIERYTEFGDEDLVRLDTAVLDYDGVFVHEEFGTEIWEMSRADAEPDDDLGSDFWESVLSWHKQQERIKHVEKGLQIHYAESKHDEVHEAIKLAMDVDTLYDSSEPSTLDNYDKFKTFLLRRDEANQPWTCTRFKPTELFEILDERGLGSQLIVVLLALPIA